MNKEDFYKKFEKMTYEESFDLAEKEFFNRKPELEGEEEDE